MAQPVTIGDQTFIKTGAGWIDKKTKQPADKGLVTLLDSVSVGEATKKSRAKIDRNRNPVTIAGTKYVYDLNQQGWIDEKTRAPATKSLQVVITQAINQVNAEFKTSTQEAKKAAEDEVAKAYGAVAAAAAQNVKTQPTARSGGGNLPIRINTKVNTPIVAMIGVLANIDSYLKQRLDNQKTISDRNVSALREQSIETPDAEKLDFKTADGKEEKKSNAAAIVGAIGLGAIIAAQFEPVQEAFKSVVEFSKSVYGFLGSFIDIFNDGLKGVLGDKSAVPSSAVSINAQKQLTAAPGYNISKPSNTGDQYVYKQGATEGYKVNQNAQTGIPSIDYSKTSTINKSGAPVGSINTVAMPASQTASPTKSASVPVTSSATASASPQASSSGTSIPAPATSIPMASSTSASAPSTGGLKAKGGRTSGKGTPTSEEATRIAATQVSGNVFNVNTPETGPGWGIVGAKDSSNRPLAFSKEGAEAFSKMMKDSGGAVKPSDVASSKRSVQKNAQVGGATNSPHLRGVAMDIHGTSSQWIRKHGYKYGWKPHDYAGTHGGHFVFGGAGMTPDEGSSFGGMVVDSVTDTFKLGAKFIKSMGKELVGERTYVPIGSSTADPSKVISESEIAKTSAIAKSRTAKPPVPPAALPNLNISKPGAPIHNPPTQSDRSGSLHYLERQGLAVG